MRAPRVLVLASRQALEVLGPAADLALDAIGAERARMSDLSDALSMFDDVDVVLADVTRPSPAISFELGVATAKGVPTIFVASDVSKVSPAFSSVVTYDRGDTPSRVGYQLAKHLEDALGPHRDRTPERSPSATTDPADTESYRRGEIIEGLVVHINTDAGFALIRSGGRRPAMLHVSNMSPSLASAFEDGELVVGEIIRAEVIEVDESRDQVQLRDVDGGIASSVVDARSDQISKLLRRWAGLEKIMGPGLRSRPDRGGPDAAFRRFVAVYEDDLARARKVRNSVAHGETPSEEELREAIDTLDELRRVLRAEREEPPRSDRRNPMLGARIVGVGNHPIPSEALHLIDSLVLQIDMHIVRTPHTEAEFWEWRDGAGGLTHQADRIAGYLIELNPGWASHVHNHRSEPIADVGPTFSSEHEGWKRELLQLRTRLKEVRDWIDQ